MFGSMKIFVSEAATEEVARFPDKKWTKRRRRRVFGKYGSWTIRKPTAFKAGPVMYMHPKLYAKMKQVMTATGERTDG